MTQTAHEKKTYPNKLNLGCGSDHMPIREGWINVDKYFPADLVIDLEERGAWLTFFPWPWQDNSIKEVLFHHSLEHMGETTEAFFHIIKELYRVCACEAIITIHVPHPRHDDFINDPTHVRIITPKLLCLFSKDKNEEWAKDKLSNTNLALQLGVNFVLEHCEYVVESPYDKMNLADLQEALRSKNNVCKEMIIKLKCFK